MRGVVASVLGMINGGATHVGVATDHVIESFRNDLWPGYKTGAGIDPDLLAQFPLLEEALAALGVVGLADGRVRGRRRAGRGRGAAAARDPRVERVLICTPDKDLAQCVRGTRVVQLNRRTRHDLRRSRRRREVRRAAGVDSRTTWRSSATPPTAIRGLRGWGAKSAAAVLARYGHLESIPDDWRDVGRQRRESRARWRARWRASAIGRSSFATWRRCAPISRSSTRSTSCAGPGRRPAFAPLAARLDAAIQAKDKERQSPHTVG